MPTRSLTRSILATTLIASFVLTPVAALAQSCDPNTEARLAFLEGRLDENQRTEKLWWRSWLAVFTIGLAFQTYEGITTRDGSNQAADFVQAGKSGIGILNLTLRPHVGRHGAAPMREISKDTAAGCAQRLQLAEKTMALAAKEANSRWSWKRHLTSLVLNLGAAVAVAEGWDDPGTGWRDFAVSEVSAEVHLWTHPTKNYSDWDEYRQEFSGAPLAVARPTLRFASGRGGLNLIWKF